MTPTLSRPSLVEIIVRTWRIKAARVLYRSATVILALAEHIVPPDMRR